MLLYVISPDVALYDKTGSEGLFVVLSLTGLTKKLEADDEFKATPVAFKIMLFVC